jgi:phage terminase small subunit
MKRTILGRGKRGVLTIKEKLFVAHMLLTNNQSQSYIEAGFKGANIAGCASALARKPIIAKALAEARERKSVELGIDANYVLGGLKTVAERCMQAKPKLVGRGKIEDGEVITVQARDASGELLFEFDSTGANRSLELLGKHLGMFKNEVDINVKTYQHFKDQESKYGFGDKINETNQKAISGR